MKIAVTGGSGRLGRVLVELLAKGNEVVVLDLNEPPAQVSAFARIDIHDRPSLEGALWACDAVIHLAAIDASFDIDPDQTMQINAMGTWKVLSAAADLGLQKAVICSSVAALNLTRENPPRYLPVDEAHPGKPRDAYGLSKLLGEQIGSALASPRGLSVTCLRLPLVVLRGEGPDSLGETTTFGSYVRAEDAAKAFERALHRRNAGFSLYHIAAADTTYAEATIDRVLRLTGRVPVVRDQAHYSGNPRASILDISKASGELGWIPEAAPFLP